MPPSMIYAQIIVPVVQTFGKKINGDQKKPNTDSEVAVYVCMYVCLFVCMYVCTYVLHISSARQRSFSNPSLPVTVMYVCIHVCMYVCMYVNM